MRDEADPAQAQQLKMESELLDERLMIVFFVWSYSP